jgi:hypothetical protein
MDGQGLRPIGLLGRIALAALVVVAGREAAYARRAFTAQS